MTRGLMLLLAGIAIGALSTGGRMRMMEALVGERLRSSTDQQLTAGAELVPSANVTLRFKSDDGNAKSSEKTTDASDDSSTYWTWFKSHSLFAQFATALSVVLPILKSISDCIKTGEGLKKGVAYYFKHNQDVRKFYDLMTDEDKEEIWPGSTRHQRQHKDKRRHELQVG